MADVLDVPVDQLHAHPENPNRMPERLLCRLTEHIRRTGRYPALVVRPSRRRTGQFEIIDGFHRWEALRRCGHVVARCEVWRVDDHEARLLLLTLNRLRGSDHPTRRSSLLRKVHDRSSLQALSEQLPEDLRRLRRLLEHDEAPGAPDAPADAESLPHAVTFFLTGAQRQRLLKRLREVASDRSSALVDVLQLEDEQCMA